MKQELRFFRIDSGENAGWYADVPGHTLEDNQMISGSDTFLEELDMMTGGGGGLTIIFSADHDASGEDFKAKLIMKHHDGEGATYVLAGPAAEEAGAAGHELWICNVTHDVLGEHPRSIYIYDAK